MRRSSLATLAYGMTASGLLCLLTACNPSVPRDGEPRDGEGVLQAMRAQRRGEPPGPSGLLVERSAEFQDGRRQQWRETVLPPGRRRLDVQPGPYRLIFRHDSLFEIRADGSQVARAFIHPLSLLQYDVFAQPVPETAQRLRALGFDLGRVHRETWQGRPVYVIGPDSGDRNRSQLWIDAERLALLRLVENRGGGQPPDTAPLVQEAWLGGYRRIADRWYADTVQHFRNGRRFLTETVRTVRSTRELTDADFDPTISGSAPR